MLTNEGISTTLGAMNAPRRTIAPGTARKPAALNSASPQAANFSGTLSQPIENGVLATFSMRETKMVPVVVEPERQQHGLLQPLVDDDLAALSLRDPHGALVERIERRIDGVARLALGRGVDLVARLPGGFDGFLEVACCHGKSPSCVCGHILVAFSRGGHGEVNVRRR